jgi:biopolymer transport protein ExbB
MLTDLLLDVALLGSEWVLWVLVALSAAVVFVSLERAWFFARRSVEIDELRLKFEEALEDEDYEAAADLLDERDHMEATVVLFGLRDHARGPSAVEDRMTGALATERQRYERFLPFLGTIGNNAPFIGLFGTVIGIIGAFANLAEGSQAASEAVMASISEALIATGVGLLVAIPAVIAYNAFKSRVKHSVARTDLLGRTLLAYLREEPIPRREASEAAERELEES